MLYATNIHKYMNKKNPKKSGNKSPQKQGGKKPRQKRIWVTDEITRTLTVEFETSGTTVLNALKFASYSDQAKQIRERAMKLMEENEISNKELMSAFHL